MIRAVFIAIVAIALAATTFLLLPPRALRLAVSAPGPAPVRGVIHVHSRRSDGSGTVDDIAVAANRAGLRFIVFTDHGDATRAPDAPVYLHGVLCIDAVEISTDGGHVVALGLGKAPYPLGGDARDVVEDLTRLGAFSIAAHPGSAKPGLRWTEWSAPFGGMEWLNGDSEWRDETPRAIATVLFTYPFRAPESLAQLLDRPDDVMRRWDVLTRRRPVVALAAADAHARLGTRGVGESAQGSVSLHIPTYEQVFRTFSITLPQAHLTGDATADATAVLTEIRRGHVYSSVDALAEPARLAFTATSGGIHAAAGDVLPASGPVALHVDTNAPADSMIALFMNGAIHQVGHGPTLAATVTGDPAVYRVEVTLPNSPGTPPVPWLVSNPVYVGMSHTPEPLPQRPPPSHTVVQYDNGPAAGFTVEHSRMSSGAFDVVRAVGGTQIAFRYALGGSMSEGPYAALSMPAGPALAASDRIMFTAHADRPMRISLQIRTGGAGERWRRSVYLDSTPRDVSVFFDDMTPVGMTTTRRPPLDKMNTVLWVIDTVNSRPGTNGQIWIDDVKYGAP